MQQGLSVFQLKISRRCEQILMIFWAEVSRNGRS